MKFFCNFLKVKNIIFMLTKPQCMLVFFTVIFQIMTSCSEDKAISSAREKFLGNYRITQICDNVANPSYFISVSKSDVILDQIIFHNLGTYEQPVTGTVSGDTVVIPSQDVSAGMIGDVTVSGGGKMNVAGDEINLLLDVLVPGPNNTKTKSTCEITGRKQ